jgi:hypothetical protein
MEINDSSEMTAANANADSTAARPMRNLPNAAKHSQRFSLPIG